MILNTVANDLVENALPLSGGTMTGAVSLYSDSTISGNVADGTNDNKIISTTWVQGQYYTADTTKDNFSIPRGSTASGTVSVAKTGYTPIGVVGMNVSNASSSGQSWSTTYCYGWYLSGTTVYFSFGNYNSITAKIKIIFQVLYKRAS